MTLASNLLLTRRFFWLFTTAVICYACGFVISTMEWIGTLLLFALSILVVLDLLLLITIVLSFWLCFPFFSMTIAALNPLKKEKQGEKQTFRFACIITVYQNLDIAWPLVRSLLKQNYSNYRIYLVADGIVSPVNLQIENNDRFVLLQPDKPLRSKVASIDYVLQQLDSSYTHAVIFDPDNLVPAHFLSALDSSHHMGF